MTNNNMKMVDKPVWEQLAFAPAIGIAGTNFVDDGVRYIYTYFQTSTTAAQFWRYDTWGDCWQQLATPATQTGTVANMVYTIVNGSQFSGAVFGAIYLFVGNGTTCYLYRYDIGTNTWGANLGTTNVPAAFATDCYFMYPSLPRNNYETSYHSGYVRTITTSAVAATGATTISVAALPEALATGCILRFGVFDITVTTGVSRGATSLQVSGVTQALKAGSIFRTYDGKEVCISADVAASATSISVYPLLEGISTNSKIKVEQFAVLTASAAAAATSITVSALRTGIASGATAGYYGNMYLVGNNATVMYRYNIGTNTWATTNAAGTAIPAVTGAVGTGCALKWLPAYDSDKLWCLRAGGTANIYTYSLSANTWSTLTFYPNTETFTTGTSVAARDVGGKQATLLIQKDATMRIYEGAPYRNTIECKLFQSIYPTSTAVVGDRSCVITSPDGVDFYYLMLHSSTGFVRCALLDS